MLQLDENNKRVTWRLTNDVHTKLRKIAKSSGLTMEEIANLVLRAMDWEQIKDPINAYRLEKRAMDDRKKKATQAVSSMSPELLEKLANANPEELAKLLNS
jgi:hypothetical protein